MVSKFEEEQLKNFHIAQTLERKNFIKEQIDEFEKLTTQEMVSKYAQNGDKRKLLEIVTPYLIPSR